MKFHIARIVLFGFAIVAVAYILLEWKRRDRAEALRTLESRYQVRVEAINDEVHIIGGTDLKNVETLVSLLERAEKLEDGTSITPDVIDLTGNKTIKTLAGIGRLRNLKSIIAIDCPLLEDANGVTGLPLLNEIILTDNPSLKDVSAIRDIPSLVTIDLSNCDHLEELTIENLPALKNIYLSGARRLEKLDVARFSGLEQLYLDSCMKLEEVKNLGALTSLTDLELSNCQGLKHLDGIEQLGELIVLDLRNVRLPDFSSIGKLPKLQIIRLAGQENLTSLEPFSELQTLEEIRVEYCQNLDSLAGIPASVTRYAGIIACPKLTSLKGIESAAGLKNLDLMGSENLADIENIRHLGELNLLSLVDCPKINDLSVLENNQKLVFVRLKGSGVTPASIEPLQEKLKDTIFDFAGED